MRRGLIFYLVRIGLAARLPSAAVALICGQQIGLAVDNGGRNSVGNTDAEYILAGFRVIFPVALVRVDGCSAVILKAEAENFLKLLRVDIKSGYGVCRVGISSAKIASSEDEINGGAVKRRLCFFKTFRHISCADRRRIFICRKKRAEARFSVIFFNSTYPRAAECVLCKQRYVHHLSACRTLHRPTVISSRRPLRSAAPLRIRSASSGSDSHHCPIMRSAR